MKLFSLGTLLLSIIASSHAFKEEEFKKCKDIGFCRRHRDKSGPVFELQASSVKVESRLVNATLKNKQAPSEFIFQLQTNADGFLRMTIDEAKSDLGTRYRITDIIQTEAIKKGNEDSKKATFNTIKKDATQIVLSAADTTITIFFVPFKIAITVKGKPAMNFNAKGLFDFEHRRVKDVSDVCRLKLFLFITTALQLNPDFTHYLFSQDATAHECDGCWDETFRGFTDSKRKGPEAISLDISFPGSEHVYGIPVSPLSPNRIIIS